MKKSKTKVLEHYSPEVLERLPYWVREMLKLIDEAKVKKHRRVKKPDPT